MHGKGKEMLENDEIEGKVTIRLYRKSDYKDSLKIIEDVIDIPGYYFDIKSWKEDFGLEVVQPGYRRFALVVELDAKMVGVGVLELVTDNLEGLKIGYLSLWGIKKEYRGSKIGKLLAMKAVEMLTEKNADLIRIRLAPGKSTPRLLELVESIGFNQRFITVEKIVNPEKRRDARPTGFKNPPMFV
jgi:ribosomal protein S18 acetylase RimI-like enzyme